MTPARTLLLTLLLFGTGPAMAQTTDGSSPPATPSPSAGAGQPLDEVVVTGRRPVVPDMTEDYLYHKQEYERLRAKYVEEPEQRFTAGERKLRLPEGVSATQVGRPTLLERTD